MRNRFRHTPVARSAGNYWPIIGAVDRAYQTPTSPEKTGKRTIPENAAQRESEAMTNTQLYEAALKAITNLFSDTSVSQAIAKRNLNALKDEIDVLLDTLD